MSKKSDVSATVSKWLFIITLVIIGLACFVTNPDKELHQKAVYEEIISTISEDDSGARVVVEFFGEKLGGANLVPLKRENYLIFSVGKVDDRFYTFGILGQVFVINSEDKSEK